MLSRFNVSALLLLRSFPEDFGVRHSDDVAGQLQLHSLNLSCSLHFAQNASDVWAELLVLQQVDGFGGDAFK